MSDQELRDKLASGWASGSNRHGLENIYASASESFCAGWNAARAHENKIVLKPETGGIYSVSAKIYTTAETERDQLRAEIELLKIEGQQTEDNLQEAWRECDQLKAQCEKLAEALEYYGAHKTNCAWMVHPNRPCTCGYEEALAEYRSLFPADKTK